VVTGHDRDEIGLLVFPSLAGLKGLCPHVAADAELDQLIPEPAVRQALIAGLSRHNAAVQGSSMRIARCLILSEPPSIDAKQRQMRSSRNQRTTSSRLMAAAATYV
jgi:feruloyl-CoA synthase